jgi:PepSY-associated TM region
MMRALILLHRSLGVAFCLFFAMWFASGIVMHFVPFPVLTEAERFAGLAALDLGRVQHGPAEAVKASGIEGATRVRLVERSDGPLYVVSGPSTAAAIRAADLADGAVGSEQLALAIAQDQARRRDIVAAGRGAVQSIPYDQWTLAAGFDLHRLLYRVALDDGSGTVLYVSSRTGEVVLDTTRSERVSNYFGSVAHWIYPTALRSRPAVWRSLVSWLSFLALFGAAIGAVVGVLQIKIELSRPVSPYRGLQAWHHWLGLVCAPFVLTWIFSGWLSMDHGRLFSTGEPSAAEEAAIIGAPVWDAIAANEVQRIAAPVKEVEWFVFGGRIFRRERIGFDRQILSLAGTRADAAMPDRAFLSAGEIAVAAGRLAPACKAPVAIGPDDAYASSSVMPGAPLFRVVCGNDWFHLDGASGELLEKLDPSRRAYRWLFRALHTLDFPVLTARPALRAALIIALCAAGFAFSLTVVALAWRRLRLSFGLSGNREGGQHADAG